jgi:hypothetical protein
VTHAALVGEPHTTAAATWSCPVGKTFAHSGRLNTAALVPVANVRFATVQRTGSRLVQVVHRITSVTVLSRVPTLFAHTQSCVRTAGAVPTVSCCSFHMVPTKIDFAGRGILIAFLTLLAGAVGAVAMRRYAVATPASQGIANSACISSTVLRVGNRHAAVRFARVDHAVCVIGILHV